MKWRGKTHFFKPWNKTFQITHIRGSTLLDQHLQKCACFCKEMIYFFCSRFFLVEVTFSLRCFIQVNKSKLLRYLFDLRVLWRWYTGVVWKVQASVSVPLTRKSSFQRNISAVYIWGQSPECSTNHRARNYFRGKELNYASDTSRKGIFCPFLETPAF